MTSMLLATRLEAVARLVDFLLGEVDAEVGDIHFGGAEASWARRFDLERDAVAELLLLLVKLADGEIGLGALGLNLSP